MAEHLTENQKSPASPSQTASGSNRPTLGFLWRRFLHKSYALAASMLRYKNFWALWIDHLGLWPRPGLRVKTRSGAVYAIRTKRQSGTSGDAYIVNELWLYNAHRDVLRQLPPGAVVIDIGAHIGVFSVAAALRNKNIVVHACEPAPQNIALLSENARLNRIGDRVRVHGCAITGAPRDEITLHVIERETGLHTTTEAYLDMIRNLYSLSGPMTETTVPARTLSALMESENIAWCDLVKIDCEGGESDIILNTPAETLRRIGALTVEYHASSDPQRLLAKLADAGFVTTLYNRDLEIITAVNPKRNER